MLLPLILVAGMLAGCGSAPMVPQASPATQSRTKPAVAAVVAEPKARWTPATFADLPGWLADDLRDVKIAFAENCKGVRSKPEWTSACARYPFDAPLAEQRAFIEREFVPYQLTRADAEDRGLITGYYEPLLKGSRTKTSRFKVPLYARPDDLLVVDLGDLYLELKGMRVRGRIVDSPQAGQGKRVVPYFDRAQIEAEIASLKPLAWVDDVVEAFFYKFRVRA